MSRTRVKICGITRIEDGVAAAHWGADAIGLVFYPRSSRYLDPQAAARIIAALPPFVTTVGLFLDADADAVRATLAQAPLDLLQFHGDESPDYCAAFNRPFIKAVPMRVGADVAAYERAFAQAKALLLDNHGGGTIGGSGERFDWRAIPRQLHKPIILAGGLGPDNVAEAIRQVRPYGVDVSSGVEAAKGIKDIARMRAFMHQVEQGLREDADRPAHYYA
ncbi:MAG: phosphoribosylanthranilate isomerase [Gammaproteobacteria bacterium]